ncbi:protein of unknown function DUF664 [Beutenbergia cavernae DSM 12333]|uniref:DinB family protein n=1 Tax=Beutenbergia cavernae (strain ATCC BAA-8 / DSM 12333 / CCUG 43141 / JCM 11478 / NBRC 16432 / NCIMB 13614 / HKI 0122) TaxID=471853 RepID=C5BY27_BEUC1|nr:DinB family protein [Beutenbergia cavernae]ACQ78921.1 protein of unknown function DUF664 [Beutenbergia cavernae DSM 12333]
MDIKDELHRKLRAARASFLSRLDGLDEYGLRRPMTPTGTNLLGLAKHLGTMEYGYLGDCVGRPAPEPIPWLEDGSIWDGGDMWATPRESSQQIVAFYRRACEHADASVDVLDLDSPAHVPWWAEGERDTTLGVLLVRMLDETAHHAGHADIVRELVDGLAGPDHDEIDDATWREYLERVQAAADAFRPSASG